MAKIELRRRSGIVRNNPHGLFGCILRTDTGRSVFFRRKQARRNFPEGTKVTFVEAYDREWGVVAKDIQPAVRP
jgi:hypothetical protein